ncbi:MAG: PSD1 and planctomycete cytochrome C domain-containing protein [Planctomycetota bacterium]
MRTAAIAALFLAAIALSLVLPPATADAAEREADRIAFFENHVRPVLVEHCYECHSTEAGEAEGGLRLDGPAAIRAGGDRGAAVVPGNIDASLLIRAIEYDDPDMEMPPWGRLPQSDIDHLRQWVDSGAVDPRPDQYDPSLESSESPLDRELSSHWAFIPPRRISSDTWSNLPDVPDSQPNDPESSLHQDPIDTVAARFARQAGVATNGSVDRATLLRRLSIDLTGLPPTAEEVQAFINDRRPDAVHRRIDRFLADPRYAERFGRHWMDLARYADTKGYATAGKERAIVGSHGYRDWLLDAFATDMPYPEMIRHQLAADQTDPKGTLGHHDAMGFLTIGRHFLRHDDTIDDRIDVIGRGLLGLTISCARCHDHKFDPIETMDYYSLYGVLDNSVPSDSSASDLLLVDRPKLRNQRVMIRGQRGNWGPVAPRRYLVRFQERPEEEFVTGSGRLDLVERISDPDNPLTYRVMTNRIWGHLMGDHLVDSPSDFGFRTPPPEIPMLLDDPAADFATHGSIKRLIRRLVRTRIYRQDSSTSESSQQIDPDNQLWARGHRRRLDFESLRDSMLSVSGHLNEIIGGPSVDIMTADVTPRRTLMAHIDRQNLPGLFRTFDFASPDMHCPQRYQTTVPQQSLYLMNHPHLHQLARATVATIRRQSGNTLSHEQKVIATFKCVLARSPSQGEIKASLEFLSLPADPPPLRHDPRQLWQYGTGKLVDNKLSNFKPFAHFKNDRYQVESTFPSRGPFKYASLGKRNGHPGPTSNHSVVRRWFSPIAGRVTISGIVGHQKQMGDGVIAVIHAGGKQIFREKQKSNRRPIRNLTARVKAGDAVDFIVAPGKTTNHDSFFWEINLGVTGDDGQRVEASSQSDFGGPNVNAAPEGLTRWEQFAQVLLLSDEFAFVD